MSPGNPCTFVQEGIGCSIYKDRPKDPCKLFECSWKASDFVPIEFSPKATGQIISTQITEGIPYMLMSYAGKDVTAEMLSWFVTFVIGRQLNAEWSVDDQVHAIGSPDFISARDRREALAREK
jgi:hypothetical protein